MKNLSLLFARRYLHSAKSLSVINTTATVSSVAIGVAVAAMVILLSVYNGFDNLVQRIDTTTEADIVVSPAKGRYFAEGAIDTTALSCVEGVEAIAGYIEESVMAEYKGRRLFGTLRGVDEAYTEVVGLADEGMMWYGKWQLSLGNYRRAVVGRGIDDLFADGYSVKNPTLHDPLTLFALRAESISPLLPISALRSKTIRHAGTLSESATSLSGHIFTSLDWAQEFLAKPERLSAIAIRVTKGANLEKVCGDIEELLGEDFVAATRYERNEVTYKATKLEKWGVFFILLLVTIIASATIIGSLVMLIGEKRNDIATLYSIGARRTFVAQIFRLVGGLIGGRGVVGGMALGVAIALVQQIFGPIKMPGNTFLVENYPVAIELGDIVGIAVAVMAVCLLLTQFTINRMIPKATKPDEVRL